MRKIKILSVLLTAFLLVSVIPVFTASAETIVTDAQGLKNALADPFENSVTIPEGTRLYIDSSIEITKDFTINLLGQGGSSAEIIFIPSQEAPYTDGFVISGATLTVNGQIDFNGNYTQMYPPSTGSLFKLVGHESKETKLNFNKLWITANQNENSLIKFSAPQGTIAPKAVAEDNYIQCNTAKDYTIIADGDNGSFTVNTGRFNVDPSAFVPETGFCFNDAGTYTVMELTAEYSDTIKSFLNDDGKFVIDRYAPSVDENYDSFYEDLMALYLYMYDTTPLKFHTASYNKADKTIYVSVLDAELYKYEEKESILETHKVTLDFNYDPEIKSDADEMISKLPKGEEEWQEYVFQASDLEIINYWLSDTGKGTDPTRFINFSGEFKKSFDNKNYDFVLDARMGGGGMLDASVGGIGYFTHKGVVYGSGNFGVEAEHILYVPTETENTVSAKKAAVQKKFDEFLGANQVTVKEGTVGEVAKHKVLWESYNDPENRNWLDEAFPNNTYEAFANSEYPGFWPAGVPHPESETPEDDWDYFLRLEMEVPEKYTKDTPCFYVEINGIIRPFMVECDSSKIVKATAYKSTDIKTGVTVSSADISVPLDTAIDVDKLESGEEYDELIEALGVGENATYDITLYSQTASEYITKLENGTFEVNLPIPEALEGRSLAVYYVASNGSITRHNVTVRNGFAAFVTDHFSTYVLSEVRKNGESDPVFGEAALDTDNTEDKADNQLGENKDDGGSNEEKSPATGRNIDVFRLFALALISGATAIVGCKKIKV